MPFILDIVQGEKDYTKLIDVQKRSDKNYYEILGKGSIGNKEFAISVILTDAKKDDVLYISVFSKEIKENRKPPFLQTVAKVCFAYQGGGNSLH